MRPAQTTEISPLLLIPRPTQAEARPAQTLALADQRPPVMPMDNPPHNGQSQAMPARRPGTAVIKAQERREDFFPRRLWHARPVIFDVHPATLLPHLITDRHPRRGMAHGIAHQVLDRPV